MGTKTCLIYNKSIIIMIQLELYLKNHKKNKIQILNEQHKNELVKVHISRTSINQSDKATVIFEFKISSKREKKRKKLSI